MDLLFFIAFSAIIFFPHLLGATIGFGATILAMPLLSLLMPLSEAKVYLILYVTVSVIWIALKSRRYISKQEALRMTLIPLPGILLGVYIFQYLPEKLLLLSLSLFVFMVSVYGILKQYNLIKKEVSLPNFLLYGILFFGGIIQGAFATSGPCNDIIC